MPKCHVIAVSTGNRCKNNAMHDAIYCVCHGGTNQCNATTKKLTQCNRYGKHNGYCWQHKHLDKEDNNDELSYEKIMMTLDNIDTYLYGNKSNKILKKIVKSVYKI
jgi:hypothetical protein